MSSVDLLKAYCKKHNLGEPIYENAGSAYWDAPYRGRVVINNIKYEDHYCVKSESEAHEKVSNVALNKLLEL